MPSGETLGDREGPGSREVLARHVDPVRAHLLLAGPHVAALYAFHDPVDDAPIGDLATAAAAGLAALAS